MVMHLAHKALHSIISKGTISWSTIRLHMLVQIINLEIRQLLSLYGLGIITAIFLCYSFKVQWASRSDIAGPKAYYAG